MEITRIAQPFLKEVSLIFILSVDFEQEQEKEQEKSTRQPRQSKQLQKYNLGTGGKTNEGQKQGERPRRVSAPGALSHVFL